MKIVLVGLFPWNTLKGFNHPQNIELIQETNSILRGFKENKQLIDKLESIEESLKNMKIEKKKKWTSNLL